jgi:TetR/AcrR family transcriptional regulator, tetracycline repressor protein
VALTRDDVLTGALAILDEYGLGDLTMRRLAGALGVQPGALYWHVANKQALLGAIADRILDGLDGGLPVGDWDTRITELAHRLRAALLAHRDGAEVVAAAYALQTGRGQTVRLMTEVLADAGLDETEAELAALTLLHYVFGHTADEQSHAQAAEHEPAGTPGALASGTARFGFGLSVFVDGLRARLV